MMAREGGTASTKQSCAETGNVKIEERSIVDRERSSIKLKEDFLMVKKGHSEVFLGCDEHGRYGSMNVAFSEYYPRKEIYDGNIRSLGFSYLPTL